MIAALQALLTRNVHALNWALRRLAAAPLASLISLLAIGIALALPAGGQMLLGNTLRIAESFGVRPQISLFLAADTDRRTAEATGARLKNHLRVREVRFVPRGETLKRFQAREGLAEVIAVLSNNPFPDAFVITPRDDGPAALEQLRDEFSRWPKVEHVQLDSDGVRRLDDLLRLARAGVALLAVLLGLGLVATTYTTIRLEMLARRAEIELSRLLGATDVYIGRPYLYLGALQGLLSGLAAWLIVLAGTLAVRGPLGELPGLGSLQLLSAQDSLILMGFATAMGWLGAALSLFRQLRNTS